MVPAAWDVAKRLTNPYEYLHSTPPSSKTPVAKKTPASRAYFKMIEILSSLPSEFTDSPQMTSFHLAEGPGGFIEALVDVRASYEHVDKHFGITLLNEDSGTPGWRKGRRFLQMHPDRVVVYTGADGTGDIMNIDTFEQITTAHSSSMSLITGDGGIDFSLDYSKQEETAYPLIVAEAAYAVSLQAPGGTFILKVFDTVLSTTQSLLYSLSLVYESVCICKPYASRPGNSERYVVCTGFKPQNHAQLIENAHITMKALCAGKTSFHCGPVPDAAFEYALSEISCILGQKQLENMAATFDLICSNRKTSEERLVESSIALCIKWCRDNHIPYAGRERTNVFLAKNRD